MSGVEYNAIVAFEGPALTDDFVEALLERLPGGSGAVVGQSEDGRAQITLTLDRPDLASAARDALVETARAVQVASNLRPRLVSLEVLPTADFDARSAVP